VGRYAYGQRRRASRQAERIKFIRDLCGGRGADVVIECSGVPSCFADGLDFLSSPSKYLILGQTSAAEVPIVPNKKMDHNAVIIAAAPAISGTTSNA
jgi:threonine dehydrogenase-like Zn-dependent dehydrogenase